MGGGGLGGWGGRQIDPDNLRLKKPGPDRINEKDVSLFSPT